MAKKFFLYAFRWQLSTPILALCVILIPLSPVLTTIIANLIGASIFFWVDRMIFKSKNHHLNLWKDGSTPPPLGSSRELDPEFVVSMEDMLSRPQARGIIARFEEED